MIDMTPNDNDRPEPCNAESKCAQCEHRFVCDIAQGKDHCWCMDLPAVLPVRSDVRCLCPECLAKVIREHA